MVRVEYRCRDGSPFPVTFAEVGDDDSPWSIDREHAPDAMTPLADAVRRVGQPGEARAYADCGVTMPSTLWRDRPVASGYAYHLALDLSPAEWAELGCELLELSRHHGGSLAVWLDRCLPAVREDCAWLADAPTATSFAALAERREHSWGLTSVAGLVARVDERAVAASCAPVFGDRATAITYELARGSDNETIAADRALERLARLVPGTAGFVAARDEYLGTYGSRSVSWSIDHPTLAERPDLFEAQVELLRRHHAAAPGRTTAASDRRRTLVAQIESGLADDAERARFRRRLERLASFVPVREARARWQLVASGAMRGVVQRRGRMLVDQGVLDRADDVFLLRPHEYDSPMGDLRRAVADRRIEHRHWLTVTPPTTIGASGHGAAVGDPQVAEGARGAILTGIPGASGTAEGPVRVILDLADIDRFEPGDILVTTMTSPVWTPLFGLAAAVVTDSGDALSHVAIAAREYGIPCVAGTNVATVVIADGAHVVVDGEAGTVVIGPAPT